MAVVGIHELIVLTTSVILRCNIIKNNKNNKIKECRKLKIMKMRRDKN